MRTGSGKAQPYSGAPSAKQDECVWGRNGSGGKQPLDFLHQFPQMERLG